MDRRSGRADPKAAAERTRSGTAHSRSRSRSRRPRSSSSRSPSPRHRRDPDGHRRHSRSRSRSRSATPSRRHRDRVRREREEDEAAAARSLAQRQQQQRADRRPQAPDGLRAEAARAPGSPGAAAAQREEQRPLTVDDLGGEAAQRDGAKRQRAAGEEQRPLSVGGTGALASEAAKRQRASSCAGDGGQSAVAEGQREEHRPLTVDDLNGEAVPAGEEHGPLPVGSSGAGALPSEAAKRQRADSCACDGKPHQPLTVDELLTETPQSRAPGSGSAGAGEHSLSQMTRGAAEVALWYGLEVPRGFVRVECSWMAEVSLTEDERLSLFAPPRASAVSSLGAAAPCAAASGAHRSADNPVCARVALFVCPAAAGETHDWAESTKVALRKGTPHVLLSAVSADENLSGSLRVTGSTVKWIRFVELFYERPTAEGWGSTRIESVPFLVPLLSGDSSVLLGDDVELVSASSVLRDRSVANEQDFEAKLLVALLEGSLACGTVKTPFRDDAPPSTTRPSLAAWRFFDRREQGAVRATELESVLCRLGYDMCRQHIQSLLAPVTKANGMIKYCGLIEPTPWTNVFCCKMKAITSC
eukprot:m51a1_g2375 hypothetical protein (587) ;mRNA; r:672631-676956